MSYFSPKKEQQEINRLSAIVDLVIWGKEEAWYITKSKELRVLKTNYSRNMNKRLRRKLYCDMV